MSFQIDPNIAYLLLVAGFWLVMMALLSPGTGIFEAAAVIVLLVAGWAIYAATPPVNLWALGLLLLGMVPFFLALRRSGRYIFLIASMVAVVIGSIYLFQGEGWEPLINPWLALIVSASTIGYMWFLMKTMLESERSVPTHDLSRLMGAFGEARSDIQQEGSVQVHGELWSAKSEERIPQGARVRVIGREGFILLVEKA